MKNIIYLALLLVSLNLSAQDAKDVYSHPNIGNKNVNGKILTNIQVEFSATRAYNYKQGSRTEKYYWFNGNIEIKYNCETYAYNGVVYNLKEVDRFLDQGTFFYNNEALTVSVNFSKYFDSYNGKLAPASGKSLRSKDFQEAVSYDNLKFSGVSISGIYQSNEIEENIKKYINRNNPKEELSEEGGGNNSDSENNDSNISISDEENFGGESNPNLSSNSNNSRTVEVVYNENINRIEENSKALEEQLISTFNTIQQNMAKERDFQAKVSSLTSIQATDATAIISEARRKSKELDIVFNQKSTDAYNEINKIGTDLAGSAENNEQLILSGGLTIGMHILSQNSIKKAKEEAKRQLDIQKEQELKKITDKIINKYSPLKKTSYERIPFTVLKEEEQYFYEQYHFSKCMCDNARKIITNDFECDKITLKYQIQKESYSAEEYYNAFKRKSNSEKKRIQEKAEYFLDLAITHKNSKAVWLIDKANYGDYNTYQKLIFANKALAIDAENLIIQEAYSKFKKKYQALSKQASLHSKIMTNNDFDWNKHSGLFVVKIEDTYFMCQENGVVISPEIKMFLLSEFNNDVSIFIKESPSKNNKNNYFGLIDKSGNVITKEKYNYIKQFSDDLALAKNESGYQFINNKGENVFNKIYNGAFSFKDGVARVSNSNDKSVNDSISASIQSNSQFYFINTKGERILTNDFNIIGDFSEGLALARNNKKELVFLNTDGQVEFEVDHKLKVMHARELSNFKSGFSLLRKSTSQFYYLDKKGNIVIKTSYFNPQPFNENRALVSNFKDGKLTFSFIDTKGKLICDFEYDGASNFSEGRAAVSKDGKWGFIDLNGKLIIPLNYDSLGVFKNGIAGIVENGKFYKIDLNGKIIE